jgi:hypothetical protein
MTGGSTVEARSERSGARRAQAAIVTALGIGAAALAGWLVIHILVEQKKGADEVARIVDGLRSKDRAEATAAFERLQGIPDDSLVHLLPFVASGDPTVLTSIQFSPPLEGTGRVQFGRGVIDGMFTVADVVHAALAWRFDGTLAGMDLDPHAGKYSDVSERWRARLDDYLRRKRR